MHERRRNAGQSSNLTPFLLGGIMGGVLGILLAPGPGCETRRRIRDVVLDARDLIESTVGRGIDVYEDARIAITSAVAAGKQAYIQEREKFQSPN
jgi:gas vesicle protein